MYHITGNAQFLFSNDQFELFAALASVVTQGRFDYAQWTKTFLVKYSADAQTWYDVIADQTTSSTTFIGNTDQNTKVENCFSPMPVGRYVRIYPLSWYEYPSLQADVNTLPNDGEWL